jgi:hypothetical protein
VHLVIQNRSGRIVSLLASKLATENVEPSGTLVFCEQPNGENSVDYFPPLDYDFHPMNISIRTGERLGISLPKSVLQMKGTCYVE